MKGPNSSRQKLINMLYLVLTAMLALNISKEVLDSFISLDDSQLSSRRSLENQLTEHMGMFGYFAEDKPEKYLPAFEKARLVSSKADSLVAYMNRIKAACIMEAEGLSIEEVYDPSADTVLAISHVRRKDDYDVTTDILFGNGVEPATSARNGDPENWRGHALKSELLSYREMLGEAAGPAGSSSFDELFAFAATENQEGELESWEHRSFYRSPLAAMVAQLSKWQMDVRKLEENALHSLFDEVEGEAMRFTRLKEAVVPRAKSVALGDPYRAEVFLAAYDDVNPPEVRLAAPGAYVDPSTLSIMGDYEVVPLDSQMIGQVQLATERVGQVRREGVIIFRPAGREEVRRAFELDYQVTAPMAIVSPTSMNILYLGVDNPISVAVPGVPAANITPNIDNGRLSSDGRGGYVAQVSRLGEAEVRLTVELPGGTRQTLAPTKFRVKSIPDPEPRFAGKGPKDSQASLAQVKAAQGCLVDNGDFLFPVRFDVLSYTLTTRVNGQPVTNESNGARLSDNQKAQIERLRPGQKMHIEDVVVRGPDGRQRKLPGIHLTLR